MEHKQRRHATVAFSVTAIAVTLAMVLSNMTAYAVEGDQDETGQSQAPVLTVNGESQTDNTNIILPEDPSSLYLNNTGLANISVEDAWLSNGEEKNIKFLLNIDPQRFLYNFYKVAGVEQPVGNLPYSNGWEQNPDHHSGGNFRGHMAGHYLSALSLAYTATKDPQTKAQLLGKAKEMIDGFKKAQDAWNAKYPDDKGYVSAFPEAFLTDQDGLPQSMRRMAAITCRITACIRS